VRSMWQAGAVAAIAAAAIASGCGSGGTGGPGPKGDTLRVAYALPASSLNPAEIDQAAEWFVDLAYDPLIGMDADGRPTPALATSWRYVGRGNRTFELTLRKGVRFSDGGRLTAAGVKAHLDYVRRGNGPNAQYLSGVRSVSAIGASTVRIDLKAPNPLMATMLSHQYVVGDVISPKALRNPDALSTSTAGAGPYVLAPKATVSGDHYTYRANPTYWHKAAVHYRRVIIRVIPNANSTLNALKTGQVDAAAGDFTTIAGATRAGLTVRTTPQVSVGMLLADRGGRLTQPLADVRVRQAINYALDRKAIVGALFKQYGRPTTQTTNGDGYDPALDGRYPHDPAKARALLAAAGYRSGFSLPLLSTSLLGGDLIAQAMAAQLAEVGIKLQVKSTSNLNQYVGKLFGAQVPAAVMGYGSQPMYLEGPGLYLPKATFNPFGSRDPEIDALYGRLSVAGGDEVAAVGRQIQRRLVELAWFAPVGFAPLVYFASRRVDPDSLRTSPRAPIPPLAELRPA
jgi:peptide/nickel transport system substrate-binding protein